MERNPVDGSRPAEKGRRSLLVVAAALVDGGGQVLVQQRPEGGPMAGLWEFPGGKVEPGESPQTALARELEEELGVVVAPEAFVPLTFASEPLGERDLLLLLFLCRAWEGTPVLRQAAAMRWVRPAELHALPMPPADEPMIDRLDRELRPAG